MKKILDSQELTDPFRRRVVYGRRGMVATSQPLAAQAGLEILHKGGNAVDAAVAVAAALTVVEPASNGIGGDSFALVHTGGRLHGMNASGRAPLGLSIEGLRDLGYEGIPREGVVPITVPGAPGGWAALNRRFGRLSLEEVMAPAVRLAMEGYGVTTTVAHLWRQACRDYGERPGEEVFKPWFDTFMPQGSPPREGDLMVLKDHGETLKEIAGTGARSFYEGALGQKITDYLQRHGGFMTLADLKNFKVEWVDPISVAYRGYEIWEMPPNGQGIVALMALNILKKDHFQETRDLSGLHRQIEAMKLAFADGEGFVADPDFMRVTTRDLLSPEYGQRRRALISDRAALPSAGDPEGSGTVYLATADEGGDMVSMIQSNYTGFGSGVVIPGTGIALHNRGANFSFDPAHPNALAGGKRPYHTIIPGFITRGGRAVGPFGVMGGFMQPQGHLQLVMNLLDFHMDPQRALEAPRWQWLGGLRVGVEAGFPEEVLAGLEALGHDLVRDYDPVRMGRGQMIIKLDNGLYAGGTEPRADGVVAAC
jgi:gamma-glutamyltranspeptidase/glutathione hydrolase